VQKRIEKIEKILASKNLEVMFARIASNLLKRDNLEEAIQICEHGLKKFSTYAQGHYILAKCYQRKGMTEEARAEFERALKFDFTHINSMRELAKIYKTAGLEDYYKDYLLKLFVIDPLNNEIVTEVRAAGTYDAWIIQDEALLRATSSQSRPAEEALPAPEQNAPQIIEPADKKSDRPLDNIYNRDKMDLSQFNNIRDDFTTILQGRQSSAEQGGDAEILPPATTGQADWTEDITISYDNDAPRSEQQNYGNADNGGEGIETAVRDLSFDEETDKFIETEQAKELAEDTRQITLNLPGPSTIRTNTQIKSESLGEEEEELPFKPPKIISQTLGEILVSQKKYIEAMEVFRVLQQKNPDNKNFDKKIEFLQKIIALEKDQPRQA
jgi:tetratricopeptide (TPR) repeat protein